MTFTILPDRLEKIADLHLVKGGGSIETGPCIMNVANWLAGGPGNVDSHPCVDPGIARFVIRLNDANGFSQWRDELKPFASKVLNTAGDLDLQRKRAYMCADWAIRTIAPMAFDFWGDAVPAKAEEAKKWAAKLRAVEPVVDEQSARAGLEVAREGRDAAYAAYAADAAAADAADAADAAYAAAYAAADAAYAAYAAADAAYAAYAAAYAADAAYAAAAAAYAAARRAPRA